MCFPPLCHSAQCGQMTEKAPRPWGPGVGVVVHTHRRARGTLETGEATVTLYASVALFACLTLVTAGALRSLGERRGQAIRWKSVGARWGTVHIWTGVPRAWRLAWYSQRDHGHQQDQWDQQDQQDPGESRESFRSWPGDAEAEASPQLGLFSHIPALWHSL